MRKAMILFASLFAARASPRRQPAAEERRPQGGRGGLHPATTWRTRRVRVRDPRHHEARDDHLPKILIPEEAPAPRAPRRMATSLTAAAEHGEATPG